MKRVCLLATLACLGACATTTEPRPEWIGTQHPFASETVYFIVTDRFVDGDPANNYPEQGGDWPSFDRPITSDDGHAANIGYLGGDFKGVADHADYIADMGFSAVWLTPIVDNPDAAFSGGVAVGEGFPADHGKTGYHGYWGVNFFALDEHLVSPDLDYVELDERLEAQGLKLVLDVVCNHGSPSFDLQPEQTGPNSKFGKLYDGAGVLVADHMNTPPEALHIHNPLHRMFHRERDIGQLSNLNDLSPAVLDYCVDANLQWLAQGADAIRIDTIKHMPDAFWANFSQRIRAQHPGLFMFAEHWSYEASDVARHTFPENGEISVLDFPMQGAMSEVFGSKQLGFERLAEALHLDDGVYYNPYELMSFYDNHDMSRLDADIDGFIDANNWLFTARGIPVVYYGSETAFRAGRGEHAGNRDYYGAERIAAGISHVLHQQIAQLNQLRRAMPSLQRGVQRNLVLEGDHAAFLRLWQSQGNTEVALVLLNKGDDTEVMTVDPALGQRRWRAAINDPRVAVDGRGQVTVHVPAHGMVVLVSDDLITANR